MEIHLSFAKICLILFLIIILTLIGAPFIVEAVVWVLGKLGWKDVRNNRRIIEIETKAIEISDRTEYVIVAGTAIGIMSAIYFHYTEFVEHEDEPLWSLLLLHFLPSVWINTGMLFNFVQAVRTDAGKPDATHAEGGRNCRLCNGPQSIGTYHCPTCNQCVMHMDHHCPFTANCVGQENFKYFFAFILWSWVATVYAVWVTYHPHAHCEVGDDGTMHCQGKIKTSLLVASWAFCVLLTIFLGFIVYLMSRGRTVRSFMDNVEIEAIKPLSHGSTLDNMESRLGPVGMWWRYLVPFTLGPVSPKVR